MPARTSVARFSPDGLLKLRDSGLAAVTADTPSAAIELNEMSSYWNDGELAFNQEVAVLVYVSALDDAGTNSYVFVIQTDNEETFGGTPTTILSRTIDAPGLYVFAVIRELIESIDPDATHLRVHATLAGDTTPEVTYWAIVSTFNK